MNNDEVQRFLDAEYERAKMEVDRAKIALEKAIADQERIERARLSYVTGPDEPIKFRARRVIPNILANGKRMTREEFRAALKSFGWRPKFEERDLNKIINANRESGALARDAKGLFYYPDDDERERILRDGREKKKP